MVKKWVFVDGALAAEFVRACDFQADLLRADESMKLARAQPEGPMSDLHRHLIDSAVLAYCLCFSNSTRRPPLPAEVVPEELRAIHERTRTYRNRVLAHVDSPTQTTRAATIINREGDTFTTRPLVGMTSRINVDHEFIDDLESLIAGMLSAIEDEIERADLAWRRLATPSLLEAMWNSAEEIPTTHES